jgi:glycine cleavage system H protein
MTVLLVILTFAVFIAIDFFAVRRGAAPGGAPPRAPPHDVPPPVAAPEPTWVAGYQLPEALHYHRGHTWAQILDEQTVAVGMDDFARRLLGSARDVTLPAVGAWLAQGDRGFGVRVDGRSAELLSPVAGEVVEVNSALRDQPTLMTDDPYGRGWAFKLRPDRLTVNLRNLMSGRLARRWLEEARESLDLRVMALSGSVLQDGGEPTADFGRHLPTDEWKRLVREFLLT